MSTDNVSDAGGTAVSRHLTVYLLKRSVKRPEDAVHAEKAGDAIATREITGLNTGKIYVSSSISEDAPWAAFLRGIAVEGQSIPPLASQSHSAVLVVQHGKRFFAVVFGHGRYLLKPETIERDYGLRSAAGLVNPERIQTLESLVGDSVGLHVRRQMNEGSDTSRMGLEVEHETLRSVSGRLGDERVGRTVSGADSLSIHTKVGTSDIAEKIGAGWRAYSRRKYRRRFGYIDWRTPVKHIGQIASLDAGMISTLLKRSELLRLSCPEVQNDDPATWTLTSPVLAYDVTEEDLLDLREPILSVLGAGKTDIGRSQAIRLAQLQRISSASGATLNQWLLYQCLYYECESEDGKSVLVLSDGQWWRIDRDYISEVDARLDLVPTRDLGLPKKCKCETEGQYNARVAVHLGWFNFDTATRQFKDGGDPIEVCDLFSKDGAFIHVKNGTDGSPLLSHLFSQASVSADLFQHLPAFQKFVVRHLGRSGIEFPDWVISGSRSDIRKFQVGLAMIRNVKSGPLTHDLSFFARNQLARSVDAIQRMGYPVFLIAVGQDNPVAPHDVPPFAHHHQTDLEREATRVGKLVESLDRRQKDKRKRDSKAPKVEVLLA